jgi:large conductance mechanosensitive channel
VLKEFRDFIDKGNVVGLAVAVILGIAFGAVVKALTDRIIMPLIAVITGGDRLSFDYSVTLRGVAIQWGAFVTEVVNFLIIAFAVFLMVKAYEAATKRRAAVETELDLLQEIRDLLAEGRAPTGSGSRQ